MKKIVIIGPESTGKSHLCAALAAHYHTGWCPEYARDYLLANGKTYTYGQLLTIARGQLALEDQYSRQLQANGKNLLFIDTDMYVMKVWCEFVFNKCHSFILDTIASRRYDLYLLCNTDLPWVKDELREYPDPETREELFRIYRTLLIDQQTPWAEIRGQGTDRLEAAVKAVDQLLNS
ncbi:AAA family ATPase [Niabella drilacis]|uniref:Nicotinamide-nucleotide adenylyltransferase, NadR type n=1 Tax=Niabella drilacis (strain DSM 25811 / CCM 8410 / CCUG 62505 / LMG 26954 / E90) TaxID=1285928 RepID=A0A1G6PSS8_NIADE|nr:AAA family ATPase [Niabella drilacis]SDC83021.1 nicotinamide-nucleotide adenylyltransferase, NadR type [Niabella drilacis]